MIDPELATREVLWNIHHVWIMYALLVPTVAVSGYGFYRRLKLWRRGGAEKLGHHLARGTVAGGHEAVLVQADQAIGVFAQTAARPVEPQQHGMRLP